MIRRMAVLEAHRAWKGLEADPIAEAAITEACQGSCGAASTERQPTGPAMTEEARAKRIGRD